MPVSPPPSLPPVPPPMPLPLLKRIPPGLWVGLAWMPAAVQPIVQYVLVPPRDAYSLSYPRHGLDAPAAQVLLALAFLLALTGCVLLGRRTGTAYALVVGGTVVLSLAWRQDEAMPIQFLGVGVALCYLAAELPRRAALVATAGTLGVLAGYLVLRWATDAETGTASEPFIALTVVIAGLLGNSVHQASAHTVELHARAAAQAVIAERLRIAREMHDTVAHSIGIIALQAGAAARVVETQPDRAREAMTTVELVGRETLAGLRRMLGALREADHAPAGDDRDQDRSRAPAAGLADLERLAATTTAAGVRVDVRRRGECRPLPADIDLAAFRIVQEAVTNVVRHAATDRCRVDVEYRADELVVEVTDRGAAVAGAPDGSRPRSTGFGLLGMRERVALLDGGFTAGPRPEGGFRVAARLPLPQGATAGAEAGAR
ncbi:sensor histidine kinase [Streptomyces termitum]